MALPPFDRGDNEAMQERINLFFDMCEQYKLRPLVNSFALALGIHRSTLWRLVTDVNEGVRLGFTPETIATVKNAYNLIESVFEHTVTSSKTPVGGIFYGKAMLGWTEAPKETVITHRSEKPSLTGGTIEQIAAKYRALAGVTNDDEPIYEIED
jgi:hypothetical protein